MAHPLIDELKQKASEESTLAFDPLGRDEQQQTNIPVNQIEADPNQPRSEIEIVSDLAASTREYCGLANVTPA